jgi:hypothetical protein
MSTYLDERLLSAHPALGLPKCPAMTPSNPPPDVRRAGRSRRLPADWEPSRPKPPSPAAPPSPAKKPSPNFTNTAVRYPNGAPRTRTPHATRHTPHATRRHIVTNFLIDVDDQAGTATSRSTFTAYQSSPTSPPTNSHRPLQRHLHPHPHERQHPYFRRPHHSYLRQPQHPTSADTPPPPASTSTPRPPGTPTPASTSTWHFTNRRVTIALPGALTRHLRREHHRALLDDAPTPAKL